MSSTPDRPLALVGLMGAGKSAITQALGERLGVAVADLDAFIEAEEGRSIAELFEREGEGWFRRREGEVLRQALASGARVIACGGGVVLDPSNRALLRERCRVVWLTVSPGEAARRIGDPAAVASRPLLSGAEAVPRLAELLTARDPFYREVADLIVATDGRTVDSVADEIYAAGVSGC